jgi:hypothetical protein
MRDRLMRSAFVSVAVIVLASCGGVYKPVTTYATAPVTETVINDQFVVPPRDFRVFEIVVRSGMGAPCIEGTFAASGANNDIEVFLLEESQFLNWQNRHQFRSAYTSGRVTADKLRVELDADPGKYFIVFSNRFSIISNKSVTADLRLRYDPVTE